jgi:hypothetical protein
METTSVENTSQPKYDDQIYRLWVKGPGDRPWRIECVGSKEYCDRIEAKLIADLAKKTEVGLDCS